MFYRGSIDLVKCFSNLSPSFSTYPSPFVLYPVTKQFAPGGTFNDHLFSFRIPADSDWRILYPFHDAFQFACNYVPWFFKTMWTNCVQILQLHYDLVPITTEFDFIAHIRWQLFFWLDCNVRLPGMFQYKYVFVLFGNLLLPASSGSVSCLCPWRAAPFAFSLANCPRPSLILHATPLFIFSAHRLAPKENHSSERWSVSSYR